MHAVGKSTLASVSKWNSGKVNSCNNLQKINDSVGYEMQCFFTSWNSPKCHSRKNLNPIWTGLFANLKRLGGGSTLAPPPNLAISSQKKMKLGKGILCVEIFTD